MNPIFSEREDCAHVGDGGTEDVDGHGDGRGGKISTNSSSGVGFRFRKGTPLKRSFLL
jgi:hypothetical protein